MIKKVKRILFRNSLNHLEEPALKNEVNVEHSGNLHNIGDSLSPIIVEWMLQNRKINIHKKVNQTKHLLAVGSLLGGYRVHFDATVWGTGVLDFTRYQNISRWKNLVKYDVRAVRGPVTREALISCGYNCPEIYGDPAILMPCIYEVEKKDKIYDVSVIHHFTVNDISKDYHKISTNTDDYKYFIDEIVQSKKVITSSLHGLILAEAYGIPAVFMNEVMMDKFSLMKIYDWYYSTGRMSVKIATSIEEALEMEPMSLPDLTKLQEGLIKSFPYDLWD